MAHAEEVELVVALHAKDGVALLDGLQADGTLFQLFLSDCWPHVETLYAGMRLELQKATFVAAIFTA